MLFEGAATALGVERHSTAVRMAMITNGPTAQRFLNAPIMASPYLDGITC